MGDEGQRRNMSGNCMVSKKRSSESFMTVEMLVDDSYNFPTTPGHFVYCLGIFVNICHGLRGSGRDILGFTPEPSARFLWGRLETWIEGLMKLPCFVFAWSTSGNSARTWPFLGWWFVMVKWPFKMVKWPPTGESSWVTLNHLICMTTRKKNQIQSINCCYWWWGR